MSAFDDLPPFHDDGRYAHQPGRNYHPYNPFAAASSEAFPPAVEISPGYGCKYGTLASQYSLVGQPLADVFDHMFLAPDGAGGAGIADAVATAATAAASGAAAASSVARAEFCIAWPPTFPVGGPAEVIELRAAVSLDAAATAAIGGDAAGGAWAVGAGAEVALAAAAAGCCSRLLALREDLVVGDERVKVSNSGEASARLRLHSDHPGVTTCILTGERGVPTLESFEDAAPLMGLPQAARDEAHRLLWRMMHEALPPNHSVLPYDPDAFRSPVDRMSPRLQAALRWAWSHHFRAFAQDFSYLLDCPPPGAACGASPYASDGAAAAAAFGLPYGAAADDIDDVTAAAAATAATAAADEAAHYQSVLAQMVVFLRDNDMFACLATLLQTALARGLALVGHDGNWLAATPAATLHAPPPRPSPSLSQMVQSPSPGGGAAATMSSALAAIRAAAAAQSAAVDGGADASPPFPGDLDDWAVSSACSSPRPSYTFAAAAAPADNTVNVCDAGDAHDACDEALMASPASAAAVDAGLAAAAGLVAAANDDDGDAEIDVELEPHDTTAGVAAADVPYDNVTAGVPTAMAAPSVAWAAAAAAAIVVMMVPLVLALALVLGLEPLALPTATVAAVTAAVPWVGVMTGPDGDSRSQLLIRFMPGTCNNCYHFMALFAALVAAMVLAFAVAAAAAAVRRSCGTGSRRGGGGDGGARPRGDDEDGDDHIVRFVMRGAGAVLLALATWWATAAASAAAVKAAAPPAGLAAAAAVVAAAAAAAMATSRANRRREW